jgi:hypothetical protein
VALPARATREQLDRLRFARGSGGRDAPATNDIIDHSTRFAREEASSRHTIRREWFFRAAAVVLKMKII